MKVFEIMASW